MKAAATEVCVTLEDSRKSAPFSMYTNLEPASGRFYGEVTVGRKAATQARHGRRQSRLTESEVWQQTLAPAPTNLEVLWQEMEHQKTTDHGSRQPGAAGSQIRQGGRAGSRDRQAGSEAALIRTMTTLGQAVQALAMIAARSNHRMRQARNTGTNKGAAQQAGRP